MSKVEQTPTRPSFKERLFALKDEVISTVIDIAVKTGEKGLVFVLLLGCPGDDVAMTMGAVLSPTSQHNEQQAIVPTGPELFMTETVIFQRPQKTHFKPRKPGHKRRH
jgi:hypothetical protein